MWRTLAQIFSEYPGIYTQSAGPSNDAEATVTPELLAWADLIFVIERAHRNKFSKILRAHRNGKRVVCLDIPDEYDFMAPFSCDSSNKRSPPAAVG